MTNKLKSMWRLEELSPFGLVVRSDMPEADLSTVDTFDLKELIQEHRVVVLRDFAPLAGTAFPEFCQKFGALLEWDFGAVNDLRVHDEARNYLYTNHSVPFHWDGAFLNRAPHYIFFHCAIAPSLQSGGETLFCDTTRVLSQASTEQQKVWERILITYTTEKVIHYGGTFTSPIIARHPINEGQVLRYAEPVVDLNPVRLVIKGIPDKDQSGFIEDMNLRLNDKRCCYSHSWITEDVVIADNYTLLHGRRAFEEGAVRHIRRVNVL
jgi:L-tyrosine isonitrile desaturase/decarboxylase